MDETIMLCDKKNVIFHKNDQLLLFLNGYLLINPTTPIRLLPKFSHFLQHRKYNVREVKKTNWVFSPAFNFCHLITTNQTLNFINRYPHMVSMRHMLNFLGKIVESLIMIEQHPQARMFLSMFSTSDKNFLVSYKIFQTMVNRFMTIKKKNFQILSSPTITLPSTLAISLVDDMFLINPFHMDKRWKIPYIAARLSEVLYFLSVTDRKLYEKVKTSLDINLIKNY